MSHTRTVVAEGVSDSIGDSIVAFGSNLRPDEAFLSVNERQGTADEQEVASIYLDRPALLRLAVDLLGLYEDLHPLNYKGGISGASK